VEAVGLVWLLLDVVAVVEAGPAIVVLELAIAGTLHEGRVRGLLRVAAEPVGHALLAEQDGTPRRDAAAAIVERADHLGAGRIGRRLQPVMPGRRPGDLDLRECRDAAAVCAVGRRPPPALRPPC